MRAGSPPTLILWGGGIKEELKDLVPQFFALFARHEWAMYCFNFGWLKPSVHTNSSFDYTRDVFIKNTKI